MSLRCASWWIDRWRESTADSGMSLAGQGDHLGHGPAIGWRAARPRAAIGSAALARPEGAICARLRAVMLHSAPFTCPSDRSGSRTPSDGRRDRSDGELPFNAIVLFGSLAGGTSLRVLGPDPDEVSFQRVGGGTALPSDDTPPLDAAAWRPAAGGGRRS